MWIDRINFFTTGVSWWCDSSSVWGVMCLCLCCEPDWEWVCACVDKCCTQNIVMMFDYILCTILKYCTVDCHLYVWSKPSAAYPPLIKLLSLAGAFCSSFLIISLCLFQQKHYNFQSVTHLFPQPPLLSAEGRSGIHLNPLLSEHWGVGVERQCTDHNGRPIISSKGGWGVGRSERLWGEWINTPVNF